MTFNKSLTNILYFAVISKISYVSGQCDGCANTSSCHIFASGNSNYLGCYGTFSQGASGLSSLCSTEFVVPNASYAATLGFTSTMCDTTPLNTFFFIDESGIGLYCNEHFGTTDPKGLWGCATGGSTTFLNYCSDSGNACSGIISWRCEGATYSQNGTSIMTATVDNEYNTLALLDANYGGAICIRAPNTATPSMIPSSMPIEQGSEHTIASTSSSIEQESSMPSDENNTNMVGTTQQNVDIILNTTFVIVSSNNNNNNNDINDTWIIIVMLAVIMVVLIIFVLYVRKCFVNKQKRQMAMDFNVKDEKNSNNIKNENNQESSENKKNMNIVNRNDISKNNNNNNNTMNMNNGEQSDNDDSHSNQLQQNEGSESSQLFQNDENTTNDCITIDKQTSSNKNDNYIGDNIEGLALTSYTKITKSKSGKISKQTTKK